MKAAPIRQYGFAITAVILLGGFSIASGSYAEPLPEQWRQTLGFAPINLASLKWHRMLTSLLVTAGAGKFVASILMLGACVAMAESRLGTSQTVKLFVSSHLVTLLTLSLGIVLPAAYFGSSTAQLLANTYDVGPSAGYYGCLGAVIAMAPRHLRLWFLGGVLSVLALRFIVSVTQLPEGPSVVSADIAHLLALPFGFLAAKYKFAKPEPDHKSESA